MGSRVWERGRGGRARGRCGSTVIKVSSIHLHMVVIGGVEAALREGRWDKKAWRDAEDTREAAVGWLLAAAGGHLAANGNELAQKLVEDGFDTWTAMDLTEQELKEFGFSRGGARSFATECRGMRGARGIFDRPPQKN